MTIDIYTSCPCGSGKKIKFCCGDLAPDIERVVRMIEGDQRVAALQLLNNLLKKHPNRVALLDLKSTVVMVMAEWDQAAETVDRILALQPNHVSSLARRSILYAFDNQVNKAISSLQQAVECLHQQFSEIVIEAFYAVGCALVDTGRIVAAKAHLRHHWISQVVRRESLPEYDFDSRSIKELLELYHNANLPLLLKDELKLKPCPENVFWENQFKEAIQLASCGSWRVAGKIFRDLIPISGNHPGVVYNLALTNGWLADTRGLIDGLHDYARLDIPTDDAVEAIALASLLDRNCAEDAIDFVQQTYEISDIDRLIDILSENRQIDILSEEEWVSPEEFDCQNSPPPLAQYTLLDRPMPVGNSNTTREEIPVIRTVLMVYDRTTDRNGQLVLSLPKNSLFDGTIEQLKQICGNSLGALIQEQIIGTIDRIYDSLALRWCIPKGITAQHLIELRREQRDHTLVEIWPTVRQHMLGGKTPDDAAKDPALRLNLRASLLILETTSLASGAQSTIQDLRKRLDLGAPEPIDPAAIDPESISFARVMRLETGKLDDQTLVRLYRQSKTAAAEHALVHLAREVVQRPHLRDQIDFFEAYEELITHADNVEDAVATIQEARKQTAKAARSDA
ncbi:MAG: hypothetical protein JW829_13790, partial [Pirellulales bacterium]|nr:hypothetical protein [Pirellulales bacterium]